MIDYITDMSTWEKWQRDYQYGLILIMPPDEVAGRINPLRAKYDPKTDAFCPAHITLSDPLGLELTPERDAEIAGLLASVKPFTLFFDKPLASRQHAGVAYPIRPREPIDNLRTILHQASVFTRPPYYTRKIAPHMTLAEFVTIEESWRIIDELGDLAPSGSLLCDRLTYIVPDNHMHFHQVKTYRLGGLDLRPAAPDDGPALGRLHTSAWREAYKGLIPDGYLAKLNPEKRGEGFRQTILKGGEEEIWCIERAGALAGFVSFGPCRDGEQPAGQAGEIYAIYLDPSQCRQGLGTALCRRAEERLVGHGYNRVVLWVLEGNRGSRAFYEAMGYAADGATKELVYGDTRLTAICYRKDAPPLSLSPTVKIETLENG